MEPVRSDVCRGVSSVARWRAPITKPGAQTDSGWIIVAFDQKGPELVMYHNKNNLLGAREGSTAVAFPPAAFADSVIQIVCTQIAHEKLQVIVLY